MYECTRNFSNQYEGSNYNWNSITLSHCMAKFQSSFILSFLTTADNFTTFMLSSIYVYHMCNIAISLFAPLLYQQITFTCYVTYSLFCFQTHTTKALLCQCDIGHSWFLMLVQDSLPSFMSSFFNHIRFSFYQSSHILLLIH